MMYYGPQGAPGCQRGAGFSVGPRFGLETAKTRNQGRFQGFIRALALLPAKSSPYPVPRTKSHLGTPRKVPSASSRRPGAASTLQA